MIDTHAHLTWPTFDGEVDAVVERAESAGIVAILDLATNVATARRCRDHAHRFESVWFGAGVHPNDAGEAGDEDLATVQDLCADERCVAVAEIGLDFYRDHTDPAVQERWFRDQLELARRIDKPVVIHDRESSERLLAVLDDTGFDGIDGPGGVFHCFAGDAAMAREVLDRGFHISFTGNITYKKSDRPDVARLVPLDRLMLETDSPFMAPVPRRGRTNEPRYIPYIAAAIAQVHGVSVEEVARRTTRTAIDLFRLPDTLMETVR